MDNRERNWYEAAHGEHPPTCACVDCFRQRKKAEEESARVEEEQARMRVGAEERIAQIKKRTEQKS